MRGRWFFFFQAEDGIRDIGVTGVQTCALPISSPAARGDARRAPWCSMPAAGWRTGSAATSRARGASGGSRLIGREACRGRGEISVVAVSLKKKYQASQQISDATILTTHISTYM